MDLIFAAIITGLLLLNTVLLLRQRRTDGPEALAELKNKTDNLAHQSARTGQDIKSEFAQSRTEYADQAARLRMELGEQLNKFTQTFAGQLQQLIRSNEEKLDALRNKVEQQLHLAGEKSELNNRENRTVQKENLDHLSKSIGEALLQYREQVRELFTAFRQNQETHYTAQQDKLIEIRGTLERSIGSLQEGNEKKLEEMRKTVDEKLEQTLQTRLTQSFNLVNERLEHVHKGLGEMQQLAIGVGDLKKVLSNVKTRGILGERQLANILEQMLAPEQYEVNCVTKKGTANRVEFAIRIPQQNRENNVLLMPVDSKFPIEDYYALLQAHDNGDPSGAEQAGKALENAIKKAAKDIHEKYISPPDTAEMGILFLPVEGLYAEAVRRPSLMEYLQREYQVIITGPTTFSAILHTISFGYKTMALEQRSGEIKKTLSAVKTEFGRFSDVLRKAQDKIHKAGEDIDELVGTRTKQINAKLKSFETLNDEEAGKLLGNTEV